MLLSASTRKRILQIPFTRELSNIYLNLTLTLFYNKLNKTKSFVKKLQALKNKYEGKRCFIVGSGPSLKIEQLEAIRNEDCFGANRIYKLFTKTAWRPKYYVIQDKYDKTKGIYDTLEVENFFVSDTYWKEHGLKNPNATCFHLIKPLNQNRKIVFSEDVSNYVQAASTVTYTMIQFAVYMGYKEIYLIGMDHRYANETNDKGVIIKKNNVKSHVFDDENPNEVVANITYMEEAYRSAKDFCERKGIKIFNATEGGALEIFERKNFWEVVNA